MDVDPLHGRRGLGTAMLAAVRAWARAARHDSWPAVLRSIREASAASTMRPSGSSAASAVGPGRQAARNGLGHHRIATDPALATRVLEYLTSASG